MNTSYLFLAPGFEEIEAITPVDVLRRADIPVKTVSVTADRTVTGAHGVGYVADMLISELPADTPAEWLILPGGMPGATNLYECAPLRALLQRGGRIAAICASPAVVLGQLGLLNGRRATCYPGFEQLCTGAEMTGERVVVDGNIITANGPGTALDFALTIVAETLGAPAARTVASGMLL